VQAGLCLFAVHKDFCRKDEAAKLCVLHPSFYLCSSAARVYSILFSWRAASAGIIFIREGKKLATQRRQFETQRNEEQAQPAQSKSARTNDSAQRGATGASRRLGQNGNGHSLAEQLGLQNVNEERLARGLGWFSLGLGLAELLAPRGVAKIAGLEGEHTGLIRLFGLREIASGIGIFMQQRPAGAVWARVAGDALDLTCMGVAFASPETNKGRLAFATANVLAVTALDVVCAQQLTTNDGQTERSTRVKRSLAINATPAELYQFWRNFENLPCFMKHLESVRVTGEGRSRWVAKAPAGMTVAWEAELTEDRPDELIAWRSLENSDVYNAGSVRFERAPGERGTIVHVDLEYEPPGGVVGKTIAILFGEEPSQQVYDALRCLKQIIETGEIIVSDGTIWDNGLLTQRPARPVSSGELNQAQGSSTAS
jgi:uncharacterized membrane protein